ncbi:MAG: M28 family peptidase, partial [Gemmatimonadales bacterium]
DVRGDILLALDGDPGPHQPGRFRGDTATRYGSALYKYAEAERRGAAGMFLVHSPYLGYAWDAIRNVRSGEQLSLADGLGSEGLAIAGWLTSEVAAQVAAMGGLDFPTLLETARDSDFRPIETGVSVSVTAVSRTRRVLAANVAGVLPGRDPEKAQEAVVFVAHYDHLGIGAGAEGDSIYNGAYDNASGTALLIALADAFGGLSRRPARSLLFLAVTGKEAGCLGSRYYVKHPLFPLARTVASITIDGANLWGPTEDIVVIAGEAAGMREAAAEAAHNEGLRLETTFAPEWGFAYRSDEVCLADAGIPSVLLGHGRDYVGRMPGWGRERLEEYFRTAYHTPNDEYEPGLDLRGATQQARVAFRLGLYLSGTAWQP